MGYDENVLKADYFMYVPGEMDESIFDSKWVRMNQNFPNWMSTKSLQQKQIQNQIQIQMNVAIKHIRIFNAMQQGQGI